MIKFRSVTLVEGPEIDAWLERQAALELANDERDKVRWQTAYRLLGGTEKLRPSRAIPMELLK
jgi:hypothetical protein